MVRVKVKKDGIYYSEWYAKNRERLLPIRRKYNAKYVVRPEVVLRAKLKNATPEAKLKRKIYKTTEAGRRANLKYTRKPEIRKRRKERRLIARYGITQEQYNTLLEIQGGRCAICLEKKKSFHLDHNHKSGQIRGLLCSSCNMAIGLMKEDFVKLYLAEEYLKSFLRMPARQALSSHAQNSRTS